MTMTQLLILVALLSVAAIVAGVSLLTSPGWACIAGGGFGLVGVVLLFDPDKRRH